MNVLVLDPGQRVGWCSAVIGTHKGKRNAGMDPRPIEQVVREDGPLPRVQGSTTYQGLTVTGHGIAYLKDMALQLDKALAAGRYDLVIFERWILTAKGARVSVGGEMESSQFIGMIRLLCWKYGVKVRGQRTVALSSADRSLKCGHPSAADVARRIAAADSVSHDDGHDGSALRHLWTFFFEEHV